MGVAQIW